MGEPLYDDDDPEGDAAAEALFYRLDSILQPVKWVSLSVRDGLSADGFDGARAVIARAIDQLRKADAALVEASAPPPLPSQADADDLIRRLVAGLTGAMPALYQEALAEAQRTPRRLTEAYRVSATGSLIAEANTHLARRTR